MKYFIILLLSTLASLTVACAGDSYVPGCKKTGENYCTNYTGPDHYYNKSTSDLRDECELSSGTYYPSGCPTDSAYAVCRKADYNENMGVEHVITGTNLVAGGLYYTQDECTILENN